MQNREEIEKLTKRDLDGLKLVIDHPDGYPTGRKSATMNKLRRLGLLERRQGRTRYASCLCWFPTTEGRALLSGSEE